MIADFDGTLSPIVADPAAAAILPAARRAIERLVDAGRRGATIEVAILSGRTAPDVVDRIEVAGVIVLGNHGLELASVPDRARSEAPSPTLARLAALAPAVDGSAASGLGSQVAARLGHPTWLVVEAKPPGIAFHYRRAPDPAAAFAALSAAVDNVLGRAAAGTAASATAASGTPASDTPASGTPASGPALERLDGRRVIEVRPVGGGKGAAVERVIRATGARTVVVLGDDRTDIQGFAAAAAARAGGDIGELAIVAVESGRETPPGLIEGADVVLPGPEPVAWFLDRLAERLATRPDSG